MYGGGAGGRERRSHEACPSHTHHQHRPSQCLAPLVRTALKQHHTCKIPPRPAWSSRARPPLPAVLQGGARLPATALALLPPDPFALLQPCLLYTHFPSLPVCSVYMFSCIHVYVCTCVHVCIEIHVSLPCALPCTELGSFSEPGSHQHDRVGGQQAVGSVPL